MENKNTHANDLGWGTFVVVSRESKERADRLHPIGAGNQWGTAITNALRYFNTNGGMDKATWKRIRKEIADNPVPDNFEDIMHSDCKYFVIRATPFLRLAVLKDEFREDIQIDNVDYYKGQTTWGLKSERKS